MSFFTDDGVMPAPFNLLPDLHSFVTIFKWCSLRCNDDDSPAGGRRHGRQRRRRAVRREARCNSSRCCFIHVDDRCGEKQREDAYQEVGVFHNSTRYRTAPIRLLQRHLLLNRPSLFEKRAPFDVELNGSLNYVCS